MIKQGVSVPEAHKQANDIHGLIAGGMNAATSAAIMSSLGKEINPFNNPIGQEIMKIGKSAIISGLGDFGESIHTQLRSGEAIDVGEGLEKGLYSAGFTALFGLLSTALQGKKLMNMQGQYNILKKMNNVLEEYGFSPIKSATDVKTLDKEIRFHLRASKSLTETELLEMFKEMGISQENALKYIKDWAWGKKALNGTTGNSIETDTTDSATNLNDSAIPMPSSNSEAGHVFIPKEAWERFNQTGEYSDIKAEPVLSTGEVMISKRDFDILKNNNPSFVESIKDNIRDSAGGITKRENSQNSIVLGEQEDDISNWNSPRNKALYNNFFEQFREAGYTRGQSRALAQMTLDHVIKRSIDTGIAPEDVVKINIKNRKIIRDDEIAESEYFNQTLNFDNDLNVNIDSDMLKNLETAKTMLKAGEDSDTIKLKTGWEVKNGKLLYDASAEKTPQEIDRLNKLNALKSMIRDLDKQTGIYKSEAVKEANRKFNNGTIDLFEHAEEVEKARRSNPAYNDIFRQIDELNNSTDNQVATLKNFKQTFDKLDRGRIFVRIPDMRKELNWPREVFDNMLIKLRDEGVIALHVGDTSLMTPDEVENSFVDENGFRLGTVTWENN
ncbi:MAG: hypothetical protein IJQ99_11710, partial [Synergistaceae bacterium]|nr:hypothetical protein [Synergistaceae bacterium]